VRQRRKRAACLLKSGLIKLTIRETLAFDALYSKHRTFPIIEAEGSSGIKAEVVFREIAMQVLFLAMLIDTTHSAFEY
jgi:hypothetical protein